MQPTLRINIDELFHIELDIDGESVSLMEFYNPPHGEPVWSWVNIPIKHARAVAEYLIAAEKQCGLDERKD